MFMPVVHVRPVGMRVLAALMPVRVLMARYRGGVLMRMVIVIMPVQVGMLHFMMNVTVLVPFQGDQPDGYDQQHERNHLERRYGFTQHNH